MRKKEVVSMKKDNSEIAPPNILLEDGKGDIDELDNEQRLSLSESSSLKKHKHEFSKTLCVIAVIIFTIVAIYAIVAYYYLMRLAIELQSSITPDASLPIAGITSILAAVLSYCLYQGALKTSLNKNKLTVDDNGVIKPILQDIILKDGDENHCEN